MYPSNNVSEIYQTYYNDIYRYLLYIGIPPDQAEDLVQNCFVKALKSIGGFRGDSSIKTWLFSIARHEAADYFKSTAHRVTVDALEEGTDRACIENIICDRESRDIIWNFIANCKEPKRSLLVLRLLDEMTFPEIAALLGKSETWCRVTYMRLKNALLEELEDTT